MSLLKLLLLHRKTTGSAETSPDIPTLNSTELDLVAGLLSTRLMGQPDEDGLFDSGANTVSDSTQMVTNNLLFSGEVAEHVTRVSSKSELPFGRLRGAKRLRVPSKASEGLGAIEEARTPQVQAL